jgi:glutaconate CoA-transferase subunit A
VTPLSTENKVMSATNAVRKFVKSSSCVSFGGFTINRNPMALIHEIIKQGIGNLHVVMHSGSQALDLLIGTSRVTFLEIAYGANGRLASTCIRFRKAVENKSLKVEDYSNYHITLRFLAGAMGVPFLPTYSGLGSDILEKWGFDAELRKSIDGLSEKKVVVLDDPFSSEYNPIVLVPAINPDVCILHVQKASQDGSVRIEGLSFADIEQARASKHVIVSCEELVSSDELRIESFQNALPHVLVNAVVHQPLGAHPTSCYRYYDYDMQHLLDYRTKAKDDDRFKEYIERYILDVDNYEDYLDRIGIEHLDTLKASKRLGYARRVNI